MGNNDGGERADRNGSEESMERVPGKQPDEGGSDPAEAGAVGRKRTRRTRRSVTRPATPVDADAGRLGKSTESGFAAIAAAAQGRPPDDDLGRAEYPRLYALLAKRFGTDGRLIRPASITIKAEGEAWIVTISVPWAKVSTTIAYGSLLDSLSVAERSLDDLKVNWRLQRGFKLEKKGELE